MTRLFRRSSNDAHWPTISPVRVIGLSLFLVLQCASVSAKAQLNQTLSESLTEIARFEQWPAISQLVPYNNRIWFVNSQPYQNTNVADLYSYDPSLSKTRYERSLFSQDAGNPVVHKGLLYWPFEDPRRSAGAGEYAVTDGHRWQWRTMQSGSAMHVHAMGVCENQLMAVTGSWTGQLLALDADNNEWSVRYDYPAGDASFSRLINVGEYQQRCLVSAAATGKKEAKLFSINGSSPSTLAGWPTSDRVDELTMHNNKLYAFADEGDARTLLQFDGKNTQKLNLAKSHRPRALHSDGTNLWLVSQSANANKSTDRGALWQWDNKGSFSKLVGFKDTPISLTSHNNNVYIGTYSRDAGTLWVYARPQADNATESNHAVQLKSSSPNDRPLNANLTSQLVKDLRRIVEDPRSARNYARGLRQDLGRHPSLMQPEFGAAITRLMDQPLGGDPVTMFTRRQVSRQDLTRWYLITTLAINGHGRIDPAWLNDEQPISDHSSGKLFVPAVAAIVATGWLNQNDQPTVRALMQRLNRNSDPEWIKADVIGALSAVTEQRFGYNIDAWNDWWRQAK